MNPKSLILVTIQLAAILYLLGTGPWLARGWLWLETAGGVLAAWALWAMPFRQLRVLPEIAMRSELVTRGPYRWIRHPMYSAVLIVMLALVLSAPSPIRLGVWCVLAVDLLAKLHYEETLLMQRFPEYHGYRQRTKRLIPFVY